MRKLANLVWFGVLISMMGCGSDVADEAPEVTKEEPAQAPFFADPSKADAVGASLAPIGALVFGGEVFGEFVEDGQLDGYWFSAQKGARITLDNSNRGTAAKLDSALFLYGPANKDRFFGGEAIVSDDDSGWGYHARIDDFEVPTDGDYMIVIGTYLNIDRGRYRLTLNCEGDFCDPVKPEPITCDASCLVDDACSGDVCDPELGCVRSEPPSECTLPLVVIDTSDVQTTEGGATEVFTVRLGQEPTNHVTVWIVPSDADEAAVFPQQLLFCLDGYEETDKGCTLVEGGSEKASHWQREVEVTVTGVNDVFEDGDTAYTLDFEVWSDDPTFGALELPPISGVNTEATVNLDYSDLDGLTDEALLQAMYALVRGHHAYGYLGSNSARTILFSTLDVFDGELESIYTGERTTAHRGSSHAFRAGFNSEHTWPQGQFDRIEPPKSDLHHVFPCDIKSNGDRSSYNFGLTDSPDASGSRLGGSKRARLFQVRPERRGDVARAHFYMVARYRFDDTLGITFDDNSTQFDGAIGDIEEEVLRQWHREDPVDERERRRNNRVEAYQGNRNLFIDRPDWVDAISDF